MKSLKELVDDYNAIYGDYYNKFIYPKNNFKPITIYDVKQYIVTLIYNYHKTKKQAIKKAKKNLIMYIDIANKHTAIED